jgi:hypothetical protein
LPKAISSRWRSPTGNIRQYDITPFFEWEVVGFILTTSSSSSSQLKGVSARTKSAFFSGGNGDAIKTRKFLSLIFLAYFSSNDRIRRADSN